MGWAGTLVQKVLKTESKYAENGDLFTRIQVKVIIYILKSVTIFFFLISIVIKIILLLLLLLYFI